MSCGFSCNRGSLRDCNGGKYQASHCRGCQFCRQMLVHIPVHANNCGVFAHTMTGGVWMQLTTLQDPDLCHFVKLLPSTVLGSWADSTVAKYGWAVQRMEALVVAISKVHFTL